MAIGKLGALPARDLSLSLSLSLQGRQDKWGHRFSLVFGQITIYPLGLAHCGPKQNLGSSSKKERCDTDTGATDLSAMSRHLTFASPRYIFPFSHQSVKFTPIFL